MSKTVSKFALAAGLVLAITFTLSCSGDDGGDSNIDTCGSKKYDTRVYSCEKGELVGSCRGKPYYPEYESCDNSGEIKEGAEISSSSLRNSSSSGGGSPSSSGGTQGGLADLPKQVYLVEIDYDDNDNLIIRKKERYDGNANISVLLSDIVDQYCSGDVGCVCTNTKGEIFECGWDYEYDTIPAGRILAGQLSLSLPANVNSKYLRKMEPDDDDEYCQSDISVVPRSLIFVRRSSLNVAIPGKTIPGKSECWIRPYRTKSGITNRAQFYYFSESGRITGTETCIEHDYYSQTNFDMNFSKGWNLVYYDDYESNQNHNSYRRTLTTDIPKDGTWEWWLQCYDYDYPVEPSSSSVSVVYGEPVTYGNETYPTVVIGTQTWFAKNLNYAVAGSKCYGEDGEVVLDWDENYNPITKTSLSPAEVQANCVKYGRLYDWATAMGLPSSCNEGSCSSQIQPKHKGICPSGWHIPSNDEWNVLIEAVGGEYTAGRKLKAKSDWKENGNGTDDYGFSALPGGLGDSDGSFRGVGVGGLWWSASESEFISDYAYYRLMLYDSDYAYWSDVESYLLSVRCVKDN